MDFLDIISLSKSVISVISVVDRFMEQWVVHFGFQAIVHSDQGHEFDNALFNRLNENNTVPSEI